MSITSGKGRLLSEYEDLMRSWSSIRKAWNDPVSRAYEETRLRPVEGRVRATVRELEKLESLVHKARKDCADD